MNIKKKRLIILLPNLELGGAERQAILLAKCLLYEKDVDVQIWGFLKAGRAAELCDEYGIPWRILSWPWSDRSEKAYSKLAKLKKVVRSHLQRYFRSSV